MKKRKHVTLTPELQEARRHAALRWKHSSHIGNVRSASLSMNNIINSQTATPASRQHAIAIQSHLKLLNDSLQFRVDFDGKTVPHKKVN